MGGRTWLEGGEYRHEVEETREEERVMTFDMRSGGGTGTAL